MTLAVSPGDLVRARGREWVLLPSTGDGTLRLRPLSGSEEDVQLLDPALEREPVGPARFDPPTSEQIATQDAASLLRDALRLSLRRGAGPFRSSARLGFEPRAYQLVPLLLALRSPVVRLLVADDVGIGKTIEAGLVLRELVDRGEADRFTVLCPPHLVEQWTGELRTKFDLDAIAVTAGSAQRLERELPPGQSLFEAHNYTVVSLDYIKADRRREEFARVCPSLVVVDEAHACVGTERGRQQRFDLLQRLVSEPERHMLLLTATPHSGNESAFGRLLSLLDEGFSSDTLDSDTGRTRLARHFVQRRRIDIVDGGWGEDRAFPKHETKDLTYRLIPDHLAFHEAVLDWCLGVVESAGADQRRRRLAFWGTLALMRCVGSSPAAAIAALRNRIAGIPDRLEAAVFDFEDEEGAAEDVAPDWRPDSEGELLQALIARAEALSDDPKLKALIAALKQLNAPVIFCRYIATAEMIGAALAKAFPKHKVEVVTGALTPDERRARVETMADHERRILVATDCLSEGINLQSLFDAVVHYDLSWNPTRHQQREGRVDRFGQPEALVRSVLLYSPDSAIDGAVLDVILTKARRIREATGVTVTLPEDTAAVTGALMRAVLLRRKDGGNIRQFAFDFGPLEEDNRSVETMWRDAEEGEKLSRTRFAQRTLRPDEVLPEWRRWRELLGSADEVEHFVDRAFKRLDVPLEPIRDHIARAHLGALPTSIRERIEARGLDGTITLSFDEHVPAGAEAVTRAHPLVATLAEALLESALDPVGAPVPPLGRAGAWPVRGVAAMQTVALLRLRFKLTVISRNRERLLLAEETVALAWQGLAPSPIVNGSEALALLDRPAAGDLAEAARQRAVEAALTRIASEAHQAQIAAHAQAHAEQLAVDHARVRDAGRMAGETRVEAVLPADVIGLFVLLPALG
jgi:superfamily II DNA or RNA helicase